MLRIYLVIFLGLLLAGPAEADGLLRFVTGEFNSFGAPLMGRARVASGPFVEVIQTVCAQIHYRCVIEQEPWRRALLSVEEGRADAFFAIFPTPPRESKFRFTPPLVKSRLDIYSHRSRPFRYRRLEDLKGHRVHVFGPSSVSYVMRTRLRGIAPVHEEYDSLRLIRKLNAGRYGNDLAIMNHETANQLIRRLGLSQVEEVGTIEQRGYGFAFSRMAGIDTAFQDFMAGLGRLMADGTIPAIIRRHHLQLADAQWPTQLAQQQVPAACSGDCAAQ